jgi:hypothetical protein
VRAADLILRYLLEQDDDIDDDILKDLGGSEMDDAVIQWLLEEARAQGAEAPVFGDASDGSVVIVDTWYGNVWTVELEEP